MSIPKPVPVTRRVEYSDWSDLVTCSSLNQSECGERCGMLLALRGESAPPKPERLDLQCFSRTFWVF